MADNTNDVGNKKGDALARISGMSEFAQNAFKSLATSKFGVNSVEDLSSEQVDQLMMTETMQVLLQVDDTQSKNQPNPQKSPETRPTYSVNPNAKDVNITVDGMKTPEKPKEPEARPTYSINPNAKDVNITVDGMKTPEKPKESEARPTYSINPNENMNDVNITVDGMKTPEKPKEPEARPTYSINPNANMNDVNITVDGMKPPAQPRNAEETIAPGSATEHSETPSSAGTPSLAGAERDFSEGFELSKAAKGELDKKYHHASVMGLFEAFASASEPEDGLMAVMVGCLLYLPNKALKYLDEKEIEAKEKKEYIETKAQAHDDNLDTIRGWSATDRSKAIYKDFLDNFGHMPEMAAKLRQEHPELVEGLGLQFDENGRVTGDLNDKQIEILSKRILENNYDKTYGHRPTDKQLKELWTNCNNMLRYGDFEKLGREAAASATEHGVGSAAVADVANTVETNLDDHVVDNVAIPSAAEQPVVTEESVKKDAVELGERTVMPTAANDIEEIYGGDGDYMKKILEESKNQQVSLPSDAPAPINVDELKVNPEIYNDASMRDKVISVDAKPLEDRKNMNLKDAHAFSVSVTNPTALKTDVNNFNVTVEGVKTREQQVEADRNRISMARQPKQDENISINVMNNLMNRSNGG